LRTTNESGDPWEIPRGTIDVWWRGKANGPLMLLLAHLLTTNGQWRRHEIRLLRVAQSQAAVPEMMEHLNGLIELSRIRATGQVLVRDDVRLAIQETSRDAAIVILGFEAPADGTETAFHGAMERLMGPLPRVLLVDSAGDVELGS